MMRNDHVALSGTMHGFSWYPEFLGKGHNASGITNVCFSDPCTAAGGGDWIEAQNV